MTDLADWQLRVIAEKDDLEGKLKRLGAFLDSERAHQIEPVDQFFLQHQMHAMVTYRNCLAARIERFNTSGSTHERA